jgi:hypothetical protein
MQSIVRTYTECRVSRNVAESHERWRSDGGSASLVRQACRSIARFRPSWLSRQLTALIPRYTFQEVPGVAHNLGATDPSVWIDVITRACRAQVAGSR